MNLKDILTTVVLVIIMAVVYYMVDSQRRAQEKELKKMRDELKINDKVVTFSGLSGVIDEIFEDRIIIKTYPDDVKISIEKWTVAGLDDRYIGKEQEVGGKDEITKKD